MNRRKKCSGKVLFALLLIGISLLCLCFLSTKFLLFVIAVALIVIGAALIRG